MSIEGIERVVVIASIDYSLTHGMGSPKLANRLLPAYIPSFSIQCIQACSTTNEDSAILPGRRRHHPTIGLELPADLMGCDIHCIHSAGLTPHINRIIYDERRGPNAAAQMERPQFLSHFQCQRV